MEVRIAIAEADVRAAFLVMVQLRPHLSEDEFVVRVGRQSAAGYHLAVLDDGGRVVAAAGYRFHETLVWGKLLYVDDLVTAESDRSRGYGQFLFDWLFQQARDADCHEFHLDSGVQRFAAHRFYLRNRMRISSHHFSLELE